MNKILLIKQFTNLPDCLCKSNYVDMLLFLSGFKPTIRFILTDSDTKNKLILWCNVNKFKTVFFEDNLIYISKSTLLARLVRFVDNSSGKHEYILGLLLGYPSCCCKKISSIGEENIDAFEITMSDSNQYCDEFWLINPSGYKDGFANISHIPCTHNCKKSLRIAKAVYAIVSENIGNKAFAQWGNPTK